MPRGLYTLDFSEHACYVLGEQTQRTSISALEFGFLEATMELGAFSVSLAVKDIEVSKQFYAKLGFTIFGGDQSQNWLIMKNGEHVIGLFQGMFDQNILTFNPGWNQDAQPIGEFTDVRELQRQLKAQGLTLMSEADEDTTGPASFVLVDPDGNPILVDQHL
jgi:catechol 2,3-dioxygenase-like lactoylglutathione lyase family enzyme